MQLRTDAQGLYTAGRASTRCSLYSHYLLYWYNKKKVLALLVHNSTDAEGARVVGALPPALCGASTSWQARLPTSGPNRQLSAWASTSWQARQARHGMSAYVKHTSAYVTYADVC
jgi:hypothetical protein